MQVVEIEMEMERVKEGEFVEGVVGGTRGEKEDGECERCAERFFCDGKFWWEKMERKGIEIEVEKGRLEIEGSGMDWPLELRCGTLVGPLPFTNEAEAVSRFFLFFSGWHLKF